MQTTLEAVFDIETKSEANLREHWAKKSRRIKGQRRTAFLLCRAKFGIIALAVPSSTKYSIELTRITPRILDDDNLRGALKAVRDGIADWIGIDDGSNQLEWIYSQLKESRAKKVGVKITVKNND